MSLKPGMIERYRKAMPIIQELMKDIEWIQDEFNPSEATEEERSQVKHIRSLACNPFDEAGWRLNRMFAVEMVAYGKLYKNSSGRYEIMGTEYYFTCGSSCEAYLPFYDDEEGNMTWIPTGIEAKNGEYYFTARPNISMNGVLVRVRGRK